MSSAGSQMETPQTWTWTNRATTYCVRLFVFFGFFLFFYFFFPPAERCPACVWSDGGSACPRFLISAVRVSKHKTRWSSSANSTKYEWNLIGSGEKAAYMIITGFHRWPLSKICCLLAWTDSPADLLKKSLLKSSAVPESHGCEYDMSWYRAAFTV